MIDLPAYQRKGELMSLFTSEFTIMSRSSAFGFLASLSILMVAASDVLADSNTLSTQNSKPVISRTAYSSPFFDQVKLHFKKWDSDGNGELSVNEIELSVHNTKVKGKAAAAAASLRRGVRANRNFAPVTLQKLAVSLQTKSTTENPQPRFESMYEAGVKKLQEVNRQLFTADAPAVESISQGRLGDCFLLASLGTCAYRCPERLREFMKELPDGRVEVTYGDGRKVIMEGPSDGEIIIGATSRGTGTWTNMYEKAIGLRMLEESTSKRHVTPFSYIGGGGTPNVPVQVLTGHQLRRHGCELYRDKTDENGASLADLTPLRNDLKAAFQEGRLVVGGCGPKGKQTLVKGIYYNHSYGVLEYDEETDTVLFWNPFGHKYTPKGPDGLQNGYTTEHGKFRVPLKEAVMWFGSFSIETNEPSEKYGPKS